MKTKHIIITLIIVLLILFFVQKKEHAGSTPPLSNEAIQNIAKVYADTTGTSTFNNIRATGTTNLKDSWFPHSDGNNYIKGSGITQIETPTRFSGKGTDTWFPYSDGRNYIRGSTTVDGDTTFTNTVNFKGKGTDTWFPFTDGKNYIRGPTQVDGDANFNADIKYKGVPLVNCQWVGDRWVLGDQGCNDDILLTCTNGKLTNMRFAC